MEKPQVLYRYSAHMPAAILPLLPPKCELESRAVLERLASAHRYMAELKGLASTIRNAIEYQEPRGRAACG